jgi:tetratricopeptide (TPR) repeat protein
MPYGPEKISRFWQELKRRRVIKVIAMYAATAFIIMEAADIMFPRLGLPDWTVTLVIALLIAGFPVAIILSWIFDVTPAGIRKTDPVDEISKEEAISSPGRSVLSVSNGVIAILLVVVCILLYPKIFRADKFSDIRDDDGRISLAVMPFINLTQDTVLNVWQQGIQNLLINSLSNSEELAVRQPGTMFGLFDQDGEEDYASLVPAMGKDIASRLKTSTYIVGNIIQAGDQIRVSAQLRDAGSEEVYRTFKMDGSDEDDLLSMSDSLSTLIRNYLEIKVLERQIDPDIHSYPKTHSAEAYRNYILGYDRFMKEEYKAAEMYLRKALEIDSTILNAKIFLFWVNKNQGLDKEATKISRELNSHIDQYGYLDRLAVEYLNLDRKDPYAGIRNREQVLEYDPNQWLVWFQLGAGYKYVGMHEKAIEAFENSLRINEALGVDKKWLWLYCWMGDSYHEIGNHEREIEVLEMALHHFPDNPYIVFRQAVCTISRNDTARGNAWVAKYRNIQEHEGLSVQEIQGRIGLLFDNAGAVDKARHHYQRAIDSGPLNDHSAWAMNNMAYMLCESGEDLEEASTLINRAFTHSPEDEELLPAMYDTKGWLEYKQGNYREAVELLNKSMELTGYDHTIALHLQEAERALANQN